MPEAIGAGRDADQLGQEAEIDADIAEHRPGQRCRRGQHGGALDDEEDGEEDGEQAGDAEHDAAVEREGVDRVLVGVRLPEIHLRQFGRRQFGDEGDDRAGVQRDAEDVRLLARLPVEREAFARRDREDALRAQIGPEKLRADEPEMRRHDHPLELFLGHVGKREDGPVALVILGGGAHLDAPDDAISAGRRRYLKGLAAAGVDLGRRRQVQGRVVA